MSLLHGDVRRVVHKGPQRICALNGRQTGLRQFGTGNVTGPQFVARLGNGECVQFGQYSTTFGTAKKPSRASGAFFMIFSG